MAPKKTIKNNETKEEVQPRSYEENGRLIIHSPLPDDYPGTIVINKHLDPMTVIELMKRADSLPDCYKGDDVPYEFGEFYIRFPVFDFQLKGLEIKKQDLETGRGFPAAVAFRCVNESKGLVANALDLKN